jgi:acyl-CoA synthetase (AMP-forming)/AMP-acid ligase II
MRLNRSLSSSIVDIVTARGQTDPTSLAYTFLASGEEEDTRLTWGELDRRSRAIAAAIAQRVEPGSRVLLLFPPGLEFVPAFFGTLAARATAVPAYVPSTHRRNRAVERLRGMLSDAGISLVVAPASVIDKRATLEAAAPDLRDIPWLSIDDLDDAPNDWSQPRVLGSDVALLQYTSGSTCSPRGVIVTHQNLIHNLTIGEQLGGCNAESIGVSWLPINHDMGLIGGVLQPAFSGLPVFLMAPVAFLQRPVRWLQAISRFRATHSAAPDFAYAFCARRVTDVDRRSLDLSTWRVAYNGSEPVRVGTLEAFQRAFGECGFRWESFHPAYGLAESTLLVTSNRAAEEPSVMRVDREALRRGSVARAMVPRDQVSIVSSGSSADGTRIAIVDPVEHTRCGHNQIGEIWVAGPSVAAGYWKRPKETAATFRAFIRGTTDGPFLRTGDLGFLRDGRLYVTGRLKDVLIVRGLKHYPQDLELTAEQAHPAVRPGCCAAFALECAGEEGVAIVAEIEKTADTSALIADIRREIAEAHNIQLCSVALVSAGELPRTTSGKLQRFLCRDAMLAGSLDVLACWAAPEVGVLTNLEKAAS